MTEQEPSALKSAVRRGRPPKQPTMEDVKQPPRHTPPHEPPPEQQLKNVLAQIKAATGAEIPPVTEPAMAVPPPAPATMPAQVAETPKMFIPRPTASQYGVAPNDVVQIMNRESRLYGILFIVGDVDRERVHGFYLLQGGKKEFVTVNISELVHDNRIAVIGEARVRTRESCSSKWLMDHGKPNNL